MEWSFNMPDGGGVKIKGWTFFLSQGGIFFLSQGGYSSYLPNNATFLVSGHLILGGLGTFGQ